MLCSTKVSSLQGLQIFSNYYYYKYYRYCSHCCYDIFTIIITIIIAAFLAAAFGIITIWDHIATGASIKRLADTLVSVGRKVSIILLTSSAQLKWWTIKQQPCNSYVTALQQPCNSLATSMQQLSCITYKITTHLLQNEKLTEFKYLAKLVRPHSGKLLQNRLDRQPQQIESKKDLLVWEIWPRNYPLTAHQEKSGSFL